MVKLLAVNIQTVAQFILRHLRVSNDGVERRPEFMTDVGEEHALRRVGRSASARAVFISSMAICSLADMSLNVLAKSPISPESRWSSIR